MEEEIILRFNKIKQKTLIYALIIDFIGMLSYLIPAAGDIVDFIWAPVSGVLIYFLFRKSLGIVGGSVGFIEELMPQTDIIPTATILWFIRFVFNKKRTLKELQNN
jgi:hypothetical protein